MKRSALLLVVTAALPALAAPARAPSKRAPPASSTRPASSAVPTASTQPVSSAPPASSAKPAASTRPPARAKPPARTPALPPAPAPAPPLLVPGPIGVGRVTVAVAPDRVLVTTDVTMPRGPFTSGELEAHVAFGAPGVPRAFEAELCATTAERLVPPLGASCTPLRHEHAYRAGGASAFVIGPATMAGERVLLPADALERAYANRATATLRIRALFPLPPADAEGRRELLVRLGAGKGAPYVLGEIDVVAMDGGTVTHADARLCGPNAHETSLAVVTDAAHDDGIPPPIAPRASTDDLCVRVR